MGIRFLRTDDLPRDPISRNFVGGEEGGVGVCVLFVDAGPGEGPRLHRHPYVEILIVLEGSATYNDGESVREVNAGEMAVVDAHQPHGFVNSGTGRLKQIDIHLSPSFDTEWLE